MGGRMDSCQLVVVVGDLVGVGHFEMLLVVEPVQLGLEWNDRWFDLHLRWNIEIGSVAQRFGEIEKSSQLEIRCSHCTIFAEKPVLLDPVHLAAIHIVDYNSYYTHCAVADPQCSTKKTH